MNTHYCVRQLHAASTMGDRTVLIVAHPFPPIGGGAVQRVAKFVKYLPEFGWEPVVLTLAWSFSESCIHMYDQSLLDEITARDVPIYRVSYQGPAKVYRAFRNLCRRKLVKNSGEHGSGKVFSGNSKVERFLRSFYIPNTLVESIPALFRCGREVFASRGSNMIFSTSPETVCHLVTRRLKRHTRLPWVADFRDPWTQNPFISYPTVLHRWGNALLERMVLSDADAVIVRSRVQLESLIEQYPFVQDKGHVIPNGFDPEDFVDVLPVIHNKFTAVHTGSLYGPRKPDSFLKALSLLRDKDPSTVEGVQVLFIGMVEDLLPKRIHFLGLDRVVKLLAPVSHKESLGFQKGADVLLLFSGEDRGTIAGKVYEYLASGKPILALAPPESELAGIIETTTSGVVVSPDDVPGIAGALGNLYHRWLVKDLSICSDRDRIAAFDRKGQTKKLSEIFSALCDSRSER